MRTGMIGILLVFAATILLSGSVSSQSSGNTIVNFKNNGRKPVKVCLYSDAEKTYPFALKCMTIAPGDVKTWDQGSHKQFDIFAFDPGVLDALRCAFKGVANAGLVDIFDLKTAGCLVPRSRPVTAKPMPKPIEPPSSTTGNMMRVCNLSIDEPVFFSITFALGQTNHFTQGWWRLIKNQCLDVDLEELWQKQGLSTTYRYKTYIYGETAGNLGGIVKKVWEGDDPKFAFCVTDEKSKPFGNKHQDVVDGVVWESDCAAAAGKRTVKMWPIEMPTRGSLWKWNF